MAGRPEAPFAPDALPHLIPLAFEMRKAREAAGLRLTELAKEMGYQPSYLSRACNARRMPHKDFVLSWAKCCGVAKPADWTRMWESVKAADVEYKRRQREAMKKGRSPATPTTTTTETTTETTTATHIGSQAEALWVRPVRKVEQRTGKVDGFNRPERIAAERERAVVAGHRDPAAPSPLSHKLEHSHTPEALASAIRELADRAGCGSLREMAAVSRISKSTLQHWLSGKMRPTRLDELVIALGATPRETRLFAQCMERAWSRRVPRLVAGAPVYSMRMSQRYGASIYVVDILLHDQDVSSGMVRAKHWPDEIQGITVGPFHDMRPSTVAPLPPLNRKHAFQIAVWADTITDDSRVGLELQLSTTAGEVFTQSIGFTIPKGSWPSDQHTDAVQPTNPVLELGEVLQLGEFPEAVEQPDDVTKVIGGSVVDNARAKHRRPKKGIFKMLMSLVTPDLPNS